MERTYEVAFKDENETSVLAEGQLIIQDATNLLTIVKDKEVVLLTELVNVLYVRLVVLEK